MIINWSPRAAAQRAVGAFAETPEAQAKPPVVTSHTLSCLTPTAYGDSITKSGGRD